MDRAPGEVMDPLEEATRNWMSKVCGLPETLQDRFSTVWVVPSGEVALVKSGKPLG